MWNFKNLSPASTAELKKAYEARDYQAARKIIVENKVSTCAVCSLKEADVWEWLEWWQNQK